MLTRFDSPVRRRNIVDRWLRRDKTPPMWLVQCVLTRREAFGTLTVTSTGWHAAADEDEAKFLGIQAAGKHRPGYRLDLVTATREAPP